MIAACSLNTFECIVCMLISTWTLLYHGYLSPLDFADETVYIMDELY